MNHDKGAPRWTAEPFKVRVTCTTVVMAQPAWNCRVRPILCSVMETPSDALHLRVPVCAQCAATTVRLESSVLGPLVILVWRCATCNHEWPVLTSDRERRGLLRERRASKL